MRTGFLVLCAWAFALFGTSTQAAIKVACVGDSITQGVGATDQAKTSYPPILQTLLGPDYEVRNFGSGGATLLDVESNRSYMKRSVFAESVKFEPDIVLIMLGTNDSNTNNAPTYAALDTFSNAYDTLISKYTEGRKPAPKVFIGVIAWEATKDAEKFGLQYNGGWYFFQSIIQNRMAPMIRSYAWERGYSIVDVNALTLGHSEWYSTDSVHPGDAGYAQIAKLFYARIQQELPKAVPTVDAVWLSSLDANSATFTARITSTGGLPTKAWLYWGGKDGATLKDGWAHVAAIACKGTGLVHSLQTNLLAGRDCYCRMYVSNKLGATWSPLTVRFTTPATIGNHFSPIGWHKSSDIKFDGYAGPGLGDFPVLIKLNGRNVKGFSYSQCKADGSDLRFADTTGSELSYEIEKWDPSSDGATSYIWVQVRGLIAKGSILMYWGNSNAVAHDAAFANSTWSSAYQAVWHMTDRSHDSTGRGHLLTASQGGGSTDFSNGAAGGAQYFGQDREMQCEDVGLTTSNSCSIMAWAQSYPGQTYSDWGASVWGMSGYPHGLDVTPAGNFRFNWFGEIAVETDVPISEKGFHCFIQTVSNIGGPATAYDDGWTTFPVRTCPDQPVGGKFTLGYTGYHEHWNGYIDEVRIMNTVVTPDYAMAAYNTIANNVRKGGVGFTTYGPARTVAEK